MTTRAVIRILGIMLFLLALGDPAEAQIQCSFQTITGVNFGVYDVFAAAPTDSTGSLRYRCTGVGRRTITIDLSRGFSGTYTPRRMLTFPFAALDYNLYLDAPRTIIWGDGTGGTSRYGPLSPPSGQPVTVTIYGRVPPGQDVPGRPLYVDFITATINF